MTFVLGVLVGVVGTLVLSAAVVIAVMHSADRRQDEHRAERARKRYGRQLI